MNKLFDFGEIKFTDIINTIHFLITDGFNLPVTVRLITNSEDPRQGYCTYVINEKMEIIEFIVIVKGNQLDSLDELHYNFAEEKYYDYLIAMNVKFNNAAVLVMTLLHEFAHAYFMDKWIEHSNIDKLLELRGSLPQIVEDILQTGKLSTITQKESGLNDNISKLLAGSWYFEEQYADCYAYRLFPSLLNKLKVGI